MAHDKPYLQVLKEVENKSSDHSCMDIEDDNSFDVKDGSQSSCYREMEQDSNDHRQGIQTPLIQMKKKTAMCVYIWLREMVQNSHTMKDPILELGLQI